MNTKLKGKKVDLTTKSIAKFFKLLFTGTITRGKEGYSTSIAKYFVGRKEEQYIPCFGYLICKSNEPLKVMRLEALT
jgi:hypothetical protein